MKENIQQKYFVSKVCDLLVGCHLLRKEIPSFWKMRESWFSHFLIFNLFCFKSLASLGSLYIYLYINTFGVSLLFIIIITFLSGQDL